MAGLNTAVTSYLHTVGRASLPVAQALLENMQDSRLWPLNCLHPLNNSLTHLGQADTSTIRLQALMGAQHLSGCRMTTEGELSGYFVARAAQIRVQVLLP